jgi:2,3-bisphosphoglycerate-dependent phosphoglycerate mutase
MSTVPASHRQLPYVPPEGATEFVLVRHGASAPYVPGERFPLCDGHGDPALAPEGREQAVRVADRLVNERVDAIYVTTLRRTVETVDPYLQRTGRTAAVVADLREVFLGEWEGGHVREMAAQNHPAYLRSVAEGEWGHLPGAETSDGLQKRCIDALSQLHARHPDQRVVCVVHGGVIAQICRYVTGAPKTYSWGAENASMHTVVVLGDLWQLRRFNDITHLS